ncbi:MAG: family 20 glycosylhydrolase [Bacteroidales bacterium]
MRSFFKYTYIVINTVVGLLVLASCNSKIVPKPALIPLPINVEWNEGLFDMSDSSACFIQRLIPDIEGVGMGKEEAYTLHVTTDSVLLQATSKRGLYWGMQTIRQLKEQKKGCWYLPCCKITDYPVFSIRGFMQDVGRNYQSLAMLKEQIDVLSFYKMNVFHLHLTDNPGWRLESKRYPQINKAETMSRWRGKCYTQQEFVDLVDYCIRKNVILIPEFDIPGHCEAFRKGLGVGNMSDPMVKKVLLELIDELCGLAPVEKMPYIHIGTDEVWHDYERLENGLLSDLIRQVRKHGREVIVWRPGQKIDDDTVSITQLWSYNGHPKAKHQYLDSRLNYLNHLDPLAGVAQLYFDKICGSSHGDSLRLGGILCCWNDNNVTENYDILRHNPVYPGIVAYSEVSWRGLPFDIKDNYLAKFPDKDSPLFNEFVEFEKRLIKHRDEYFQSKPFPYVRQANISWSVIGPFNNEGDINKAFPMEDEISTLYTIDSVDYRWKEEIVGGTIHLQHFFGYPSYFPKDTGTYYAYTRVWSPVSQAVDAWVGFHDWSRSGGRRGGPFPELGLWHNTNPQIWINNNVIAPPKWENPGLEADTEEISFADENYFFRDPTKIVLNKGWNEVLLRIPIKKDTWKRMFTFVPVCVNKEGVREVPDIIFDSKIR